MLVNKRKKKMVYKMKVTARVFNPNVTDGPVRHVVMDQFRMIEAMINPSMIDDEEHENMDPNYSQTVPYFMRLLLVPPVNYICVEIWEMEWALMCMKAFWNEMFVRIPVHLLPRQVDEVTDRNVHARVINQGPVTMVDLTQSYGANLLFVAFLNNVVFPMTPIQHSIDPKWERVTTLVTNITSKLVRNDSDRLYLQEVMTLIAQDWFELGEQVWAVHATGVRKTPYDFLTHAENNTKGLHDRSLMTGVMTSIVNVVMEEC